MDKKQIHELTVLYLEKQQLNNLSVSEFIKKYEDTYNEITKEVANSKSKWMF